MKLLINLLIYLFCAQITFAQGTLNVKLKDPSYYKKHQIKKIDSYYSSEKRIVVGVKFDTSGSLNGYTTYLSTNPEEIRYAYYKKTDKGLKIYKSNNRTGTFETSEWLFNKKNKIVDYQKLYIRDDYLETQRYVYDSSERLDSMVEKWESTWVYNTICTYNQEEQLAQIKKYRFNNEEAEEGWYLYDSVNYSYNKNGRIKSIDSVSSYKDDKPFVYHIKYEYSKNGRKISRTSKIEKTKFQYNKKGQLVFFYSNYGGIHRIRYKYNKQGLIDNIKLTYIEKIKKRKYFKDADKSDRILNAYYRNVLREQIYYQYVFHENK
jgi:hypothetical protein